MKHRSGTRHGIVAQAFHWGTAPEFQFGQGLSKADERESGTEVHPK